LEIFLEHNKTSDDKFTHVDLIDEFMQLFVAGTDSTGHWMTHTVYALCKNPEVFKKLKAEVDANITCKEDMTFEKISSM